MIESEVLLTMQCHPACCNNTNNRLQLKTRWHVKEYLITRPLRVGSLVQYLIRQLHSNRVLWVQPLDYIDQLCHDATDLVVLLVVLPILYVIPPDHLHSTVSCAVSQQWMKRNFCQIQSATFATQISRTSVPPAVHAGCARSSTAESRLSSGASFHGTSVASFYYKMNVDEDASNVGSHSKSLSTSLLYVNEIGV